MAVLPPAVLDEEARGEAAAGADGPADGRPQGPRPVTALRVRGVIVRELELDLDAFEGPFDLLLALVLKEELDLRDVDLAGIVTAFLERLAEREELDLEACGEFLVLIAALLELKARALFPDEAAELAELEPEEAAEELARRLAEYRRAKEAAAWLRERLAAEGDRYFRLGPAPLAPKVETPLAPQDPEALARALRAARAGAAARSRSRTWRCASRRSRSSSSASARCSRRRSRFDFDAEVGELTRLEQASAFLARARAPPRRRARRSSRPRRSRRSASARVDEGEHRPRGKDRCMDRPLRLIPADPLDRLARTLEALLVVASAPLSVEELADGGGRRPGAGRGRAAPRRRALRRGAERDRARARRRRLGLPRGARGGRRVRAAVRAAGTAEPFPGGARDARDRRVPRPVLAAGHRADPRRRRRLGRRQPPRARPDRRGGPRRRRRRRVRYRTTPLFERVFGLESLSELPRLDDVGADAAEIRDRLHTVAESARALAPLESHRPVAATGPCTAQDGQVAQSFLMMLSASSRVNARSVSVCSAPWWLSFVTISSAVSSSGASKTSTTS